MGQENLVLRMYAPTK